MNRILILFAHPAFEKSRAQYRLIKAAQSIGNIHIHDLYQHYPDFMIDVKHEQQLLQDHDIILFQHPFYWYSSPALIKEWQDLVLEHGFAFGAEGNALHGKLMANIISAGGGADAYRSEGYNHYSINDLLLPFHQTANLCGMTYLPPFVVHGTHELGGKAMDVYAEQYRQLLLQLQNGNTDPGQLTNLQYLNDWNKDI